MDKHTMIRGDSQNPYHLSIGGVVIYNDTIGLIQKPNGVIILPSETVYLDETIEDCFSRGMKSELGVIVQIEKYLGDLSNVFSREDGTEVQKTTLFFLGHATDVGQRKPTSDEQNDTILWLNLNEAIEALVNNQEMSNFITRAMLNSV